MSSLNHRLTLIIIAIAVLLALACEGSGWSQSEADNAAGARNEKQACQDARRGNCE